MDFQWYFPTDFHFCEIWCVIFCPESHNKEKLNKLECMNLSSMGVSNRIIPPSESRDPHAAARRAGKPKQYNNTNNNTAAAAAAATTTTTTTTTK